MKKTTITLLLLISLSMSGQSIGEYLREDYLKKNYKSLTLTALSGACDGFGEMIDFHRYDFLAKHPNAGDFWGNNWQRKWKNGDPSQGEAFPLSSTALVFVTDAYHLSRSMRNVFICAAIVIHLGERKPFLLYVVDFAVHSLAYSLGFTFVYDWIY